MAVVYLVLEVGLSFTNMKLMIIAISHIYALVLALWLMAHGLVSVPKNRWQEGNLVQNLNHYYLKVSSLVDALEDTKVDLKEEILTVIILKENFANARNAQQFVYHSWILDLHLKIPDLLRDSVRRNYIHDDSRTITAEQVTENFMASLSAKFKKNLYNYRAYESNYEILLSQINKLQTLIEAKSTQSGAEREQLMSSLSSILPIRANFYYQCYVKPVGARVVAIALYVACFVVLESEFFHSTRLSLISMIVFNGGVLKSAYLQVVVTFCAFLYMLFCSLNSLTRLKLFNMYHLVPKNSDPVSTCFFASYMARLTVPLSYNFITLFSSRSSVFEEWYGKSIHLTGLLNMMNNWIPRLLLIPVLLTTFNVYDKLKLRFGINSDFYGWADFEDEDAARDLIFDRSQSKRKDLLIVEGKRLVAMELARRNNSSVSQATANISTEYRDVLLEAVRNFETPISSGMGNRIGDYEDVLERDDVYQVNTLLSVWGRLGGVLNSLKDTVETRLTSSSSYQDDEENDRLFL